jgi:hypothetical protein
MGKRQSQDFVVCIQLEPFEASVSVPQPGRSPARRAVRKWILCGTALRKATGGARNTPVIVPLSRRLTVDKERPDVLVLEWRGKAGEWLDVGSPSRGDKAETNGTLG